MAMVLPAFIAILVFKYSPLYGWGMAFFRYRPGQNIFSGKPLGFSMFSDFLYEMQNSWHVVRNTLGINLLTVLINLTLAVLFAIMINEIRAIKLKKAVQTITFFPYFISWIITYQIFTVFFSAGSGLFNIVMVRLGLIKTGIDFLGDPKLAWPLILMANAWKYTGYNTVIFLSAIAGIDAELYEAAQIDGATRLQRILRITLPLLMPTLSVLVIMNAGWIFSSNFEQFFLFTNLANLKGMEVFDMYIYRYGLKLLNFSYATAVGIIKSFASIAMLLIANFISRRVAGRSII